MNGYWFNGYWYPTPIYTYSWPMLIVGPCETCGRNFVLSNPSQGQPLPKRCVECSPPSKP